MKESREISMDQDFIQKLTRTVFDNLNNEQFGAEELAVQVGLSRSQIHRRLHQINGQSVTQFIREIRLKEAHRLLKKDVGTASEIAYQVGFGSPTYFNKCFHEYYGYTPGEVRQQVKVNANAVTFIDSEKTTISENYNVTSYSLLDHNNKGNWLVENRKAVLSAIAGIILALLFYFVFNHLFNSSVRDRSIVVITFEYLGEDSTLNYYSEGMVSEILNHLYKFGDLNVKSDILSRQFANTELSAKEIGKAFGVSHILKGSIFLAGDEIRIIPLLIDAKTNELLWSDSFTGRLSDISKIIEIQSDVAKEVALACRATISPEADQLIRNSPPTDNHLAYEYYLKGNEYDRSRADVNLALESYSKAIKEDPYFVAAYARQAIMHARLYHLKMTDDWVRHDQLALNSLDKANQLDSENIEVKIAQAMYHYYIDLDCNLGISILNDVENDAPNMSRLFAFRANMKGRQEKWKECIQELNQAIKHEPFNVSYIITLSSYYERIRDFDKSIEIAREGLEKIPDYIGFRKRIFTAMRKKTGNLELAMAASGLTEKDIARRFYLYSRQFDKLIEYIKKEDFQMAYANNFHPKHHELAHAYFFKGDTAMSRIYADSAIQLLQKMLVENPLDHRLQAPLSKCYAFLGDREKAIEYAKESIKAMPVERDAIRGIGRETELLKTYALLGENDLALEQIEYLLSVPGWLTYGDLWTRPEYYWLRDHPRFQKIMSQGEDLQISL